ncbi:MAG: RHS repeat-associated core domain-containing protein, partial [Candidatus Binatia bacterium]
YAPFGRTTVTGAASSNSQQFTGRENDGLTGLYYYRARYYHPVLQRFLSEDPIGFAGGDVNLYAYVGNNPISFVDPLGLEISFDARGNLVGEEEGLEEPLLGPGDVLALGGFAGRVCGRLALGAGRILGNEIGAIGRIGGSAARGIQFAQRGVSATFRHGEFAGKTVQEVAAGLRSGVIRPEQLPIQVITRNGVTYTLNNRSLLALRQAGLEPTVIRNVTGNAFFERQLTERLTELGGSVPSGFTPVIRGGGQ